MNRYLITFLLIGFIQSALAQSAFLDFGTTQRLRVNSNGTLGIDLSNLDSKSFLDGDETKPYIGQAGLWIVAQDDAGTWHSSVQYTQRSGSLDFWPGPVDTFSGLPADIETWDNVWTVSKNEIDYHTENYTKDGYIPANNIVNWPANGLNDFNQFLAPFIDSDQNRKYNPTKGDYPLIKGDRAAYCIFNDLALEHEASFGIELGIEVLLMAYQYDESPTVYLEYFIINRSINTYSTVYCGFFLNGECGNKNDNYASTLNNGIVSTAVFQGDENDEGYFGATYPYVLATFPTQNITNTIAFNTGRGVDGQPTNNEEYIQLGTGNWRNGQPLTYGGSGIGGDPETTFIFENAEWSESPDNRVGNRTILAIEKHQDWKPKNFIRMYAALDVGSTTTKEEIHKVLQSQQKMTESVFSKKTVAIPRKSDHISTIKVYPNPSNGRINIQSSTPISEAYIYDNQGKMIWKVITQEKMQIECNEKLASGIYTLKLITKQGTQRIKLSTTN